jgi:hypothetical protein
VSSRVEWRVCYQRAGWRRAKSKTFGDRAAADRFVAKLLGPERPELEPLTFLRTDRRDVGEWIPGPADVDAAPPRW